MTLTPKQQKILWYALLMAIGGLVGWFTSTRVYADVPEDWNGQLLKGEPTSDFETNMPPLMGTKGVFHGKPLAAGPVTHDVMILYTKAAETKHAVAGIDKLVQKVITDANAAYVASKVNITVRLVYSGLSPVAESGTGVCNTLKLFRDNAVVKAQRDKIKSDLNLLLTVDTGSYTGCASLYIRNGVVDAFATAKTGSIANKTPTHELGHLQGLAHNIENAGSVPAFPWGYGYRYCAALATDGFRDIMSYPCSVGKGARQNFHGNPEVIFKTRPTGTALADCAHALNDNAAFVATYR